jgi:hypothetical protein
MTFVVVNETPLGGVLRYVEAEHSFAFDVSSPVDLREHSGTAGVTSLSIGTLQLEVGVATGLVLFVWGLHPRTRWKSRPVGRPDPVMRGARVEVSAPLEPGVTVPIASVGAWSTSFDETTGWVRVAQHADAASEQEVLVATGIALGLTDSDLDSVWLHPIFQ